MHEEMKEDINHAHRVMNTDEVRGSIQVDKYAGANFEINNGFCVSKLMFDTLLVEYADGSATEKTIGGIVVPVGDVSNKKVWRVGKVIMAGEQCRIVKAGDFVTFPNDKGIETKAVNVKGRGTVAEAIFLDEKRIFAINEEIPSDDIAPRLISRD
jgi:co-chaperonin GroES (HSP10)